MFSSVFIQINIIHLYPDNIHFSNLISLSGQYLFQLLFYLCLGQTFTSYLLPRVYCKLLAATLSRVSDGWRATVGTDSDPVNFKRFTGTSTPRAAVRYYNVRYSIHYCKRDTDRRVTAQQRAVNTFQTCSRNRIHAARGRWCENAAGRGLDGRRAGGRARLTASRQRITMTVRDGDSGGSRGGRRGRAPHRLEVLKIQRVIS